MLLTVPQAQRLRAIGTQVKVSVDGYDVTRYCASADDRQGWALVYVAPIRRREHQGESVVSALIVQGEVRFTYELQPEAAEVNG